MRGQEGQERVASYLVAIYLRLRSNLVQVLEITQYVLIPAGTGRATLYHPVFGG